MNLHLKRLRYQEDGIYGSLTGDGLILYTLEHAFQPHPDGVYLPKVPHGNYSCIRHAPNRLPYETFMLQNVPGHDGILFHIGNWNKDSDGCILVGIEIDLQEKMLLDSKIAFERLMSNQTSNSFLLTIEN